MKEKKNFSSPGAIMTEERRLLRMEYHAEKVAFTETAEQTGVSHRVVNMQEW